MLATIIVLIALVALVQLLGDRLVRLTTPHAAAQRLGPRSSARADSRAPHSSLLPHAAATTTRSTAP